MDNDYYKTLGIQRSASAEEIQKAYREMARKHHPDLNPNDPKAKSRFQAVQKAYEVLSDPQKRELYDRYGSAFETAGAAPGGGPTGGWRAYRTTAAGTEEFDLGDIFGGGMPGDLGGGFADLFRQFTRGAQRAPRTAARGRDLEHELQIPFQTSIRGGEARINIRRADGQSETITIKIPPGIEDGKRIRLRGQGEFGPNGKVRGDLIVTVKVVPHPWFRRLGPHLELTLPITIQEAIEGATIDIPTPDGVISLKVPPGTSSGKRLRIRGHGVATQNGERGDLFADVQIVIPPASQWTPEQVAAIRRLHLGPANPRADLKW